jgi:formylglycine-generating enzyme required for sulfatase activity
LPGSPFGQGPLLAASRVFYGADPFSWGSGRVGRGGGWSGHGDFCRAALREWFTPGLWDNFLGLRLARVLRPVVK